MGLQPFHDAPLGLAAIHGEEGEGHAFEQVKIVGADVDRMANDAAMHARVDRLVVIDLLGGLAQLIERRRSGGAKGVVLQELIAIDQPDFPGRRLRSESRIYAPLPPSPRMTSFSRASRSVSAPTPARSEAVSV